MNNAQLKLLMTKLEAHCYQSLETAIGYCLSQTHYCVEISHWLIKLLALLDSPLHRLLNHYHISPLALREAAQQKLLALKKGNAQTPALSPELIACIQQAWTYASVECNAQHIHAGHLFFALLTQEDLRRRLLDIFPILENISLEDLREHFLTITPSTNETATVPVQKGKLSSTQREALKNFTIDLTQQAKSGKLDAVIGREKEIRQLIDVLTRRRQNNPILVGEAGVGKTAIVEGVAVAIVKQEVPEILRNTEIRILDLALVQAGAGIKGEFENRLKNVIEAVNQSECPIILFVDEAHTLIGAGNQAGQGDAANLLKPALARGELRMIAATTWDEYKKYVEKDPALTRRFQLIKIDEPDAETTIHILRNLASKLEKHHEVHITEEALTTAVNLSKRYMPDRKLPDKAVSLLDTACARVHINQTAIPGTIETQQLALKQLLIQEERLNHEVLLGENRQKALDQLKNDKKLLEKELKKLNKKWQNELKLYEDLKKIRKEMEAYHQNPADKVNKEKSKNKKMSITLMKRYLKTQKLFKQCQGEVPFLHLDIDAQIIAEVVESWTGIPVGKIMTDEKKTLLHLTQKLKKRVVGQDHALEAISKSLQIARSNLADPRKPIGVFLLAGSSGVGKTETAHAFADIFYGNENALITINMSEYKEEHKISLLTGSPPGYVGYGEGGILTSAVRRKPYSIVLLDEMEKAHPGIQDIFYQVFDKGMLMDGDGRWVDFRNTIILITSNAGTQTITDYCCQTENFDAEALKKILHQDLLTVFKPAFLGRTTLVPYCNLDKNIMNTIVELQLDKIKQRVQTQYSIPLYFSDQLKNKIVSDCQQTDIGARNIEQVIHHELLPRLSTCFLSHQEKSLPISAIHFSLDKENGYCLKILSFGRI